MRQTFLAISTCFLIILHAGQAASQSVTYQSWQRVRGLPASVVYTVFIDRDGFLWAGTTDGVFRYDGYQFHQFTIQDGLVDNDVFQISQDSLGRIWFLTNKGWPCYYSKGVFYSGKNTAWLASVAPTRMAISIYAESGGDKIWYAALDTVYCFSGDQVIQRIGYQVQDSAIAFFQKLIAWEGSIWAVHNLGYRSLSTGKEVRFQHRVKSVHNKIYHDGQLLYYFDNNTIHIWDLVNRKEISSYQRPVGENFLCFLEKRSPDDLLLSTMQYIYSFRHRVPKADGLTRVASVPVEMTTQLLTDREGNRWLSSLTSGLWVQYRVQPPRSEWIKRPLIPNGEPCWSLSPTTQGFYAGFSKVATAVDLNHPSKDHLITLPLDDSRLRIQKVIDLPSEKWLVTGNELVAIPNKGNGFLVRAFSVKDAFIVGNQAYLAASTGLAHLSWDSSGYIPVKTRNNLRISRVVATSSDSVWMGGILGLKLHVKGKEIPQLAWRDSLLTGYVSSMIYHSSGALIFSTVEHGIGIIFQNQLYPIRISGHVPIQNALELKEDAEGAVWVLTNHHVLRLKFNIQQGKLTTTWTDYSKAIDTRNARIHSILPIRDSLYIGTDLGVFRHPLNDTRENPVTPLVRMEYVAAGSRNYVGQVEVVLPSDSRYVRFRYVGIAFQAQGNIEYRYRLEPLDQQWIYTKEREVAYPFLNHGSYRFVVEASLPDGSWSAPVYTVLTIETPFVQTIWFWLLIGGLLVGIVGLFFFLRLSAIKARHRLQQETLLFDKKLAELELQALQLQMNPHFIFNAIYAIQGFYASGDKAVAKDYIARLASLVRMIFESGKHNQIPLDHEIRLLREYVGLFQLRMEVPIHFYVEIDPHIQPHEIKIPPMLIQPIVENALQYGLAPLRTGARLQLCFLQEGELLHIVVEDNGVGRIKSARIKLDIPKSSSGLRITEQRIQLLYRDKPAFPVFEINDAHPNQENPGTIVHLRIPLTT